MDWSYTSWSGRWSQRRIIVVSGVRQPRGLERPAKRLSATRRTASSMFVPAQTVTEYTPPPHITSELVLSSFHFRGIPQVRRIIEERR